MDARFLTTAEAALSGVTRQGYNLGLQSPGAHSNRNSGAHLVCFDFQNTHPLVFWWSTLTHGEVRRAGTAGAASPLRSHSMLLAIGTLILNSWTSTSKEAWTCRMIGC